MTKERSLSLANLIIKFFLVIILAISFYFLYRGLEKIMQDNSRDYANDGIQVLLDDLKKTFEKNSIWGILLIVGLAVRFLTYAIDVVILSIASWKQQTFGKIILFITTIFPILWVISWIGNIGIIAKKRTIEN
ncbi:hypothetical protein [Mycoplasmopsis arginini]|uniref:hypothetical protein n=1 Tax=Mycoplasmopsis arginini TaxID=2094 RepID=UPI0002D192A6|nr:hypothetical protein [Mycoplasmopsis arginini]ENY69735.1 Hypothetical protein, predicted transmembrane protein [Mycoplasmopsis arginini 7264]MDI3348497.1 hypothetical protein [Mycoplasmopsis arginini]MDI3348945.1 hypothetical protein [Mycoplasmopsis arginini]BAQ54583.1 hypothetical protein MARG145_0637 [Mycoplasmopsis arginini]